MKRWIFLVLLMLFFLCSCKEEIEVSFIQETSTKVYALGTDGRIEEVYIEYEIVDEKDLFFLYTKYQNFLPIGFSSPASPNLSLVNTQVENQIVTYYVDAFIFLSDIKKFHSLLEQTGKLYDYEQIHIIFNDKALI